MGFIARIRANERFVLLLWALPFVVFIISFNYVPLAGWALAFFNYKPGIPLSRTPFIGLHSFIQIFTFYRAQVFNAFRNTVIFTSIGLALSPLPVIFAVFINEIRGVRFKKLIQTTTTLPYFISWVIIFSLAFSLFQSTGVVNNVLMQLGIIKKPTMLLGSPNSVYWFQTALTWWKGLGWSAIIYIAAIAGIDSELYDAVSVDGANRWGKMRHITIPGLMPTFVVLFLLSVGNFISAGFDQYFLFANPMVTNNIEVLDTFVYRTGITLGQYSFASAVGILKTMISIVLLFTANWIAKKTRGQSII